MTVYRVLASAGLVVLTLGVVVAYVRLAVDLATDKLGPPPPDPQHTPTSWS